MAYQSAEKGWFPAVAYMKGRKQEDEIDDRIDMAWSPGWNANESEKGFKDQFVTNK